MDLRWWVILVQACTLVQCSANRSIAEHVLQLVCSCVRGRGAFPFISQGTNLTSLFFLERERESFSCRGGPSSFGRAKLWFRYCATCHTCSCGRYVVDVLVMTCGGSHGSASGLDSYGATFSYCRGPFVILSRARIPLPGMAPHPITSDILPTMETMVLRSPLTDAA
jgi:hypothetical protein